MLPVIASAIPVVGNIISSLFGKKGSANAGYDTSNAEAVSDMKSFMNEQNAYSREMSKVSTRAKTIKSAYEAMRF